MRIKEVETLTGITSKNIRFYETEGLLSPERNVENNYRQYSDEDVRRLKEIKLFRKFGISLADIKRIQDGSLNLGECLEAHISALAAQQKDLGKVIELCTQIQKSETSLQRVDADFYLNEVNAAEQSGASFTDIAKDFLNKAKKAAPARAKFWFEPTEPIMNADDFKKELEQYAADKGKSLTILSEGMRPRILLDQAVYSCSLEMPRPRIAAANLNYGFRFVYLYEV